MYDVDSWNILSWNKDSLVRCVKVLFNLQGNTRNSSISSIVALYFLDAPLLCSSIRFISFNTDEHVRRFFQHTPMDSLLLHFGFNSIISSSRICSRLFFSLFLRPFHPFAAIIVDCEKKIVWRRDEEQVEKKRAIHTHKRRRDILRNPKMKYPIFYPPCSSSFLTQLTLCCSFLCP